MTSVSAPANNEAVVKDTASEMACTAKTMDVIRDCSPTRPKLVKTSERHGRAVLDNFVALRRQGDLCDVVLNVGSSRIRAHKVILCASSPYFKAMFTNELAESKQTEITIKDIDENAMEILIDFCYSAKITIDEKIVQSLLPAACLLQLQEVQDYCAEFLKSQLDPSNCLGIRAFADTHSCRELLKIADKYLQMNFIDVVEADEFMQLPLNQLVEIVSNDELNVRCEEQVYEACMNWIKYDLEERRGHLAQLLSQVRLPLLDTKYLVTKVGTDLLLRQDQACRDLVDEAKDYHLLPHEKLVSTALLPARYRPRRPIITGEVLFAVGGWCSGDAIASVEMFDPQSGSNEWKIVASMSKRRCGVGVGVLNNQIYAIGGHDGSTYLNNTERYDPTSNQWFSDVAPTASCRTSVGVAVMDGYLYAVGGQDGVSCLNIVDKYDPNTNRWTRMASMNSKRLGVAVVVLGTYLYAVGGSDGTSPLNTVERYDAKNNRWNFVAPMLTRRKHLGCAVFKNYIYAVGGRDDCIELNSAERYDPQTNQWQPVVAMKSRRSGVGLAVVNGVLMAIGGFDGTTYLKTCEVFDPDANMWKLSGSMIYRRLGGGVGVIKMTKENSTASNENRLQSPSSISICKTPVSSPQSNVHRSQQIFNSLTNTNSTAAVTTNNNQPSTSNNTTTTTTTPTTTTNNSWPFILSPMPSILANVQTSSTAGHHHHHHHHHHHAPSINRPIGSLSPTSTITGTTANNTNSNNSNAISIATITTSESLINDLSHFSISSSSAVSDAASSNTSPLANHNNHNSRIMTQTTRSSLSTAEQQPSNSSSSSSSSSASSSPNTATSTSTNQNSSSSIKLVDV